MLLSENSTKMVVLCLLLHLILPSDSSEVGFELIKHDNILIEIHFTNAIMHALTVIAFAEHNDLLEIDQDRNIAFDYTVWTLCKSNIYSRTTPKQKHLYEISVF